MMIFGGTPVVRLTVLGLRGVPESVREAAISFGANKWDLLTKVDLPLASPSIRAGINQTIMLSLAMVVVASLIGANEVPPLNWSTVMFRKRRTENGEQTTQARGNSSKVTAG